MSSFYVGVQFFHIGVLADEGQELFDILISFIALGNLPLQLRPSFGQAALLLFVSGCHG